MIDFKAKSRFTSSLLKCQTIVLAGGQTEHLETAARSFCEAAALSGLHSAWRHTDRIASASGVGVVELCISPSSIECPGNRTPDTVIVLTDGALKEMLASRMFDRLSSACRVILDDAIDRPRTRAELFRIPFNVQWGESRAALAALMVHLEITDAFPPAAFDTILRDSLGVAGVLSDDLLFAMAGSKNLQGLDA